ncbi:MAG: outer membrane protein assembly factor BamA [Termitinemataceae bacterium]
MRTRVVSIILCLVTFVTTMTFAQTSGEWYMGKPIKNITFEGLRHVKESELEGIVSPYIGRLFNDNLFWELQGRLYALEYFDVISPSAVPVDQTGSAVILKFTVQEKPVVSSVDFVGNSGLRKNELLDVVTVKVNDVVNSLKLRADEEAIRNKYLEKGYPDVRVSSETTVQSDARVRVRFTIDEGEKILIEALLFEGNTVFSERTLRGTLSLKARSLLNDGAFQEAKLIADQDAIAQYYRDRGYIDARVVDVIRQVRKDDQGRNLMTLIFKIYEGKAYTLGEITFSGNKIFSTDQLSALVYSKKGQPINARKLDGDVQRVADLYYENGYIFNSITRSESRDEANGTISYTITIAERPRAHIENIIIRGNKKTKEEVLLREIPLEPGDIFSKTKVLEGLRNLYNLQYFSAITPETPPGSAESLMNLVFNVEEQPTADVQFGITFSGSSDPKAFPISGLIKLNDRNFMGMGDQAGLELNASPDTQSFSLNYAKRWMFGLPLSGSFDISFSHSTKTALMDNLFPIFNGDEPSAFPDGFDSYEQYIAANKIPPEAYQMTYDQWRLSLGFATGYRWNTVAGIFSLGGGFRVGMVRNAYDNAIYRPFDPVLRAQNNQWTPSNIIWTNLSLDQRDIFYNPSRGYYLSQRFGIYGILPIEQEHYLRTDTKTEWFTTLFNIPLSESFSFKGVLGLHTGLSLLLPQPFQTDPIVQDSNKLVIDGMFVARGWYSMRYTYGLALWENWAEIRMPLAANILALDWFIDAAAVKDDLNALIHSLTIEDFRFSYGAGLRFTIPQFPFRFALAKRFKVVDNKIEWQDGGIGSWGLDFVISFALSTY